MHGEHICSPGKKPKNCVFFVKHSSVKRKVLVLFIFRGDILFRRKFPKQVSPSGHFVSRALKVNCSFPAGGHICWNALKVPQLGGSCQVRPVCSSLTPISRACCPNG